MEIFCLPINGRDIKHLVHETVYWPLCTKFALTEDTSQWDLAHQKLLWSTRDLNFTWHEVGTFMTGHKGAGDC